MVNSCAIAKIGFGFPNPVDELNGTLAFGNASRQSAAKQ
jgi:hypothetical protein